MTDKVGLNDVSGRFGLKINIRKTKTMATGKVRKLEIMLNKEIL